MEKNSRDTLDLIEGIIDESIEIPNDAVIYSDSRSITEIFTKKRMELIDNISENNPRSIQQLADLTNRKKQAVFRDLKILERHDLVELEKSGRTISPKIRKRFLIFGLSPSFETIRGSAIKKDDAIQKPGRRKNNQSSQLGEVMVG